MKLEEYQQLDETYLVQNYGTRLPIAFVRGEGMYLYDSEGRRYLDFLAGIAVVTLGHSHPKLVAALTDQVGSLIHSSNYFLIGPQAELGKRLVELSGLDRAFFCNSGAEANEVLIKVARRWAAQHWGEGVRPVVITCDNSFHGRTLATLTATAQAKVQKGFAPLMPGFKYIPFNDLEAAGEAVTDDVCAFLVEPVQGEGGINVATDAFLQGLRDLCDERGLLLLLDEVQCGAGRTGTFFAYEQYHLKPDAVALAKGLGGGVPIGAMVCTQDLAEVLQPGSHGTTFGGNFLACRAGVTVVDTIREERLLENCRAIGAYLTQQLEALCDRNPRCAGVRGRGLMIALDLTEEIAAKARDAAAERGLIVNALRPDTLRLVPPLTVQPEHVDEAVRILDAAVSAA
ncbi:MAG: aspartate aminotransferase family protein [Armatimonadetes bacterium]|nr:aspartate aminotransferase family protein [Armatimonadota bacterium]